MAVLNADLEMICGNDLVIPVQLYEGDTGTTPLNLTGVTAITYNVKHQLGPSYGALITKGLGTGIAIIGAPTNGDIEITLLDTDTLPAPPAERLVGYFAHEVQITDATGNKTTVLQGTLTIRGTGAG